MLNRLHGSILSAKRTRSSWTALASIWISITALLASTIGHNLAVLGYLGKPLGFFDRPELLGIAPMLLIEHAITEGTRPVPCTKTLASLSVFAHFASALGSRNSACQPKTQQGRKARRPEDGSISCDKVWHFTRLFN